MQERLVLEEIEVTPGLHHRRRHQAEDKLEHIGAISSKSQHSNATSAEEAMQGGETHARRSRETNHGQCWGMDGTHAVGDHRDTRWFSIAKWLALMIDAQEH
jgi:hypothetical protein